jgi:hypothetical protein
MSSLFQPVFATANTRRSRILWCAWWTGEPTVQPFRPPDAWGGGARTPEEARQLAEQAAGVPLRQIEAHWAGAWVRVRAGLPPFVEARPPSARAAPHPADPHLILGVAIGADLAALKRAYRVKSHETHPDRGGNAAAFIAVKRAYDALVARAARRPAR